MPARRPPLRYGPAIPIPRPRGRNAAQSCALCLYKCNLPSPGYTVNRLRNALEAIYAKHTGHPVEKIRKDSERDFFMNAQEAKDYGLIDEIIESRQLRKKNQDGK